MAVLRAENDEHVAVLPGLATCSATGTCSLLEKVVTAIEIAMPVQLGSSKRRGIFS
jgi:hypothetical protein